MAVKLNRSAYEHAKALVAGGKAVVDQRDDWSEHRPSAEQENRFLEAHGFAEYRKWFLGIDDEEDESRTTRCGAGRSSRCPPTTS